MAEYREDKELNLTGETYHDIRLDPAGHAFALANGGPGNLWEPAALFDRGGWLPIRISQWRSADGALLGPGWAFLIPSTFLYDSEREAMTAARHALLARYPDRLDR